MTQLTITTNTPEEATLLVEILTEIRRAKEKHPIWSTCNVKRAAIVIEEAGEVIREANHLDEGHGDVRLLRNELIQTAGTCIRFLTLIDAEI